MTDARQSRASDEGDCRVAAVFQYCNLEAKELREYLLERAQIAHRADAGRGNDEEPFVARVDGERSQVILVSGQREGGSDGRNLPDIEHARRLDQRANRLDRVGLRRRLVLAVAQHAREPQGHAAGVAGRALDAVERDLDHLLRA